jgi:cell wall-associated NlpC family hydrolase
MRSFSDHLVGLPWRVRGRDRDGVDCWGLVWLGYQANGIAAPSYAENYVCEREAAEIDALIANQTVRGPWREVAPGCERELDFLVFRCVGAASHVGLVVRPGLMLHITENTESRIETYCRGRWHDRLTSIYRFDAAHD